MITRSLVKELRELFSTRYQVGDSGCHLWTGLQYGRYGLLYVPSTQKSMYAHRVSMILKLGKGIPKGMFVCHSCDKMTCVNPAHLFLGTPSDNQQDMKRKGRSLSGEKNGHCLLTEAHVLEIYEAVDRGQTYKSLAVKYSVSATHIRRIALGKSWELLHKKRYSAND